MERIVEGKFKLGRKIGSGSFGEIFIARYLRFRGPYSSDSCPDFSALASLVVLQLKKLKRIGELLPKLPPPLPPPLSRKRFKDQITLLWKEKQAARCPSFFWFFSSVAIQPVVFLEGMFAGSLRLDLNKDPLKEWVARAVEASATTDEEISSRKDAQAV